MSARELSAPPPAGRLRLGVLALDGMVLSLAVGALDVLEIARAVARRREPHGPAPELVGHLLSARGARTLATPSGVRVEVPAWNDAPIDLLMVPGMLLGHGQSLQPAAYVAELALIRRYRAQGVRVAAACSGTLLLALSGVLDGHAATTSWWLAAEFQRRFPAVRLQPDAIVVDDGEVLTSGAGSAYYGLLLNEIARAVDPDLAQATARVLLVDAGRQSQAPYVSQALLDRPRHSLSERIERAARELAEPELTVAALAARCGVSERSLLRHFRQHYGASAQAWLQQRRIERACALLESTLLSLDEVVERCGYSDAASFRKLFKRQTTLTPAEWRNRFRLRAA